MEADQAQSGWLFPEIADTPVQDRRVEELAGGDCGVWESFESFLYLPPTDKPWFTVCLGVGDWQKIKHGTLPRIGGPLPIKKSLKSLVGVSWRRVCCGHWHNPNKRELRFEVLGEVSGLFSGGELRAAWAETILLKSWLAVADWWFEGMGRG